jgi:hypothetical protein
MVFQGVIQCRKSAASICGEIFFLLNFVNIQKSTRRQIPKSTILIPPCECQVPRRIYMVGGTVRSVYSLGYRVDVQGQEQEFFSSPKRPVVLGGPSSPLFCEGRGLFPEHEAVYFQQVLASKFVRSCAPHQRAQILGD